MPGMTDIACTRCKTPIGHLSLEDTKIRVLSVSGARPGLTPRELQREIGPRVKPSVFVKALVELAREKRIGLFRQADWVDDFQESV